MTPWRPALLAGSGIAILLQLGQPSRTRASIARVVAALTGGLAAVSLAEYATGRAFGLDRILFSDPESSVDPNISDW
ncbi:MAG: hypothetical protein K0U76_15085 [Actinomycetia bacterium]|nr:hypothetical protein [Actinomycetes bacterium]MCH9702675.1 hypothetical protein [Actinomycetes bacterium]MCH9761972.1 hypothetical protein [Actinomycetes bacterium]